MGYDYSYSYAYEEGLGVGFLIFWLIYLLVICAYGIAAYVLRSIGTYTIAKRRGIRHPWMAWVPVVDYWLLGCISDQYQYVVKGKNKSKRKVLLILNIVMWVLYAVMLAGCVNVLTSAIFGAPDEEILTSAIGILGTCIPLLGVGIALMVIRYMSMYDLYSSCCPQNNVLFLVLSIIFSVTEPFFIFFNRKKDDGMPPRRPEPQAYIPQQPQYQPPQEPWENSENQ